MKPELIISGGQTGADWGGLCAAEQLGIPTGGYAPKGWMTEQGQNLDLRDRFGLMEHETRDDYGPRTEENVRLSDATVIFGRRSRGSNLTERLCQQHRKPFLWVHDPLSHADQMKLRLWLQRHKPSCLNIAGNRESVSPGIAGNVEYMLTRILT